MQKEALEKMGYRVMTLPPFSRLAAPVATHPDMLLFPTAKGFLLHKDYYEENAAFFKEIPLLFETVHEEMGQDYPKDTLFNALPVGTTLFGGKAVAEKVKRLYSELVTVKQGYARCSAATVGDGVIVSDPSLYKALQKKGIDTLLVSGKGIAIEGYDHGFIGGASLTLSKEITAFFGKIEDHPDYKAMTDFANKQNAALLSLSSEPLTDIGGGFLKSF